MLVNCLTRNNEDDVLDKFEELKLIAYCEKCDKTALKVKYTPNIYYCMACKHSFYLEEE